MAAFTYNVAKKQLLDGDLDFNAPNDIRVLLLEAATDENADDATVSAVLARAGTTELTSTGYSRQALTDETTSQDDANDRAEFDADDVTFSSVSQAASETVVAVVYYKHVTVTQTYDYLIACKVSDGYHPQPYRLPVHGVLD